MKTPNFIKKAVNPFKKIALATFLTFGGSQAIADTVDQSRANLHSTLSTRILNAEKDIRMLEQEKRQCEIDTVFNIPQSPTTAENCKNNTSSINVVKEVLDDLNNQKGENMEQMTPDEMTEMQNNEYYSPENQKLIKENTQRIKRNDEIAEEEVIKYTTTDTNESNITSSEQKPRQLFSPEEEAQIIKKGEDYINRTIVTLTEIIGGYKVELSKCTTDKCREQNKNKIRNVEKMIEDQKKLGETTDN